MSVLYDQKKSNKFPKIQIRDFYQVPWLCDHQLGLTTSSPQNHITLLHFYMATIPNCLEFIELPIIHKTPAKAACLCIKICNS